MNLAPGQQLSHYRLVEKIGEGGMGVVWKAVDERLEREVAIKLLPDEVAGDAEHLSRFRREAKVLAGLNHANIATIHDLDEAGGARFLVMEYVAGEDLARRLSRGPLPREEVLRLGRQIAAALEAAHARGVIHRDLKPANILITADGTAKLLDFGLAKAFQAGGGDVTEAPTVTGSRTRDGVILGTVPYMSPEQARGRELDASTDLWSLGCILFEAQSGRRAFPGETVSDTLAAILKEAPDWKALPSSTPAALREVMRSCLAKDPAARPASAAAVRASLEGAGEATAGRRSDLVWVGAVIAALIALLVFYPRRSDEGGGATPELRQLTVEAGIEEFPAWSPDGGSLAYSAGVEGVRKLFLLDLESGAARQLTDGDHDDIQPAWSPDGTTLLFVRGRREGVRMEPGDEFGVYDGGDVWSLDVLGEEALPLVENAAGPSWSPDGERIALDASWAGPRRIWTVDRRGRNPEQISSDVSEAVVHLRPRWSPDGDRLVFQRIERTKFDLGVVRLSEGGTALLTDDPYLDVNPIWSADGSEVFFSSYRSGGINVWRIPVARDGSAAGRPAHVTSGAGKDVQLTLSPDGTRLAFTTLQQNADLWRLPVSPETGIATGEPSSLTATTREDSRGSWSPDGTRIAFNSDRGGEMNLWLHDIDADLTTQLTRGAGGDYQPFWSPDGERIVFFSLRSGSSDIWEVEAAGGEPVRLTEGDGIEVNPCYSPDGERIAYQSDRDGRLEVWVMGADGSDPRQLTRVGVSGHFLRWTDDGAHVVFRRPMAEGSETWLAPVDGGPPVKMPGEIRGGSHMSFSPDRSRILDVSGHRTLWVSPVEGGEIVKSFEFADPRARIDYPSWSPDGRWVLFDRFVPEGGDIWEISLPEGG